MLFRGERQQEGAGRALAAPGASAAGTSAQTPMHRGQGARGGLPSPLRVYYYLSGCEGHRESGSGRGGHGPCGRCGCRPGRGRTCWTRWPERGRGAERGQLRSTGQARGARRDTGRGSEAQREAGALCPLLGGCRGAPGSSRDSRVRCCPLRDRAAPSPLPAAAAGTASAAPASSAAGKPRGGAQTGPGQSRREGKELLRTVHLEAARPTCSARFTAAPGCATRPEGGWSLPWRSQAGGRAAAGGQGAAEAGQGVPRLRTSDGESEPPPWTSSGLSLRPSFGCTAGQRRLAGAGEAARGGGQRICFLRWCRDRGAIPCPSDGPEVLRLPRQGTAPSPRGSEAKSNSSEREGAGAAQRGPRGGPPKQGRPHR